MISSGLVFDSELNKYASTIKSASGIEGGEDLIKSILLNAIEKYSGATYKGEEKPTKKPVLKFTEKELNDMPKNFKKEFRVNGITARIYKRLIGKKKYTYDIKYRRNGYNIVITGKDLDEVKERFIQALKTAKPKTKSGVVPTTFASFAEYYFENFRKRKVTEYTLKNDMSRYNKYLKTLFGERPLDRITSKECQELIDRINSKGKGKTADEVFSILNVIMKCAIQHSLITVNPLSIVLHIKHDCEHGTSLTKEEEQTLKRATENSAYKNAFMLALYTGLRPNELNTVRVEGNMIIAVNSKRKTRKVEYKRIPICKMLKPYIVPEEFGSYNVEYMRDYIKKILPNHKLYDLRTTFHSRLKECGVAKPAREEFMGHSAGRLEDAYTDLSNEYLIKEMEKFDY
ncbi:MAG: hypothetical protein SPL13_02310 [Clostridia bacterium]|nr:hypothetical protein [Clostridia bacterium]